jgi:FMN phosphatase YigB (HAD superfamily)
MKTKLFIDFDGTLLNTEKSKELTFDIFIKAGFTNDEILAAYQAECLDYKYSIYDLIKRLYSIKKFNLPLYEARIENIHKQFPKFLFPDAVDFLKGIDRDKYEVVLLSMGDKIYQKFKVESAGITNFFDKVYFTDIQKWVYLQKLVKEKERFILIDDRSDTIFNVAKKFPKCLALEIIRKYSDDDDPMRAKKEMGNVEIRNFKQAMMYL